LIPCLSTDNIPPIISFLFMKQVPPPSNPEISDSTVYINSYQNSEANNERISLNPLLVASTQIQEGTTHNLSKSKSLHFRSIFLTFGVFGSFLFFILSLIFLGTSHWIWWISIFVFLICYAGYWIECLACATSRYLFKMGRKMDVLSYVEMIKNQSPRISWTMRCWHEEQRSRQISHTYQRNGHSYTEYRTEFYTVNVDTFHQSKTFQYKRCEDVSEYVSNLNYKIIKINFFNTWSCGDLETQKSFDFQKNQWIEENRNRDVHWSCTQNVEIPGFEEEMLCITDAKDKPCLLGYFFYLVACLFMFSWPYRMWLEFISVKSEFQFRKIIYI
jgi:hypothetical protein